MNFSEFLKQWRTQKDIATAKEHYEELGGEKKLGISLRHFQQIEAGKYPPSEQLLLVVFNRVQASDRHVVVTSFFNSIFGPLENSKGLLEFLMRNLSPAIGEETKSIWESGRRLMTYSDAQLDYLSSHPEAMRFHKRLLLLEDCTIDRSPVPQSMLKALQDLDLIEVKGRNVVPSRSLYRLPHFENSGPRSVAKATDHILKLVDLYVSREGSQKQELSFGLQMVTPVVANRILEQMRAFKRWVQSLATTDTGPNVSPLIYVGFAKELDRKEL